MNNDIAVDEYRGVIYIYTSIMRFCKILSVILYGANSCTKMFQNQWNESSLISWPISVARHSLHNTLLLIMLHHYVNISSLKTTTWQIVTLGKMFIYDFIISQQIPLSLKSCLYPTLCIFILDVIFYWNVLYGNLALFLKCMYERIKLNW